MIGVAGTSKHYLRATGAKTVPQQQFARTKRIIADRGSVGSGYRLVANGRECLDLPLPAGQQFLQRCALLRLRVSAIHRLPDVTA